MGGLGHLKARLQIVHHQKLGRGEVVCLHDLLQRVGVRLADRVIRGEDQIRPDADVQVIIPLDHLPAGKGCHADQPAPALLLQDDRPDAITDRRDVGPGVFLPHFVFLPSLLRGEAVADAQEVGKFILEAPADEFRVVHPLAGPEFLQGLQEAGIVHRDLTGDHGVVVVQDKAGVFQIHTCHQKCMSGTACVPFHSVRFARERHAGRSLRNHCNIFRRNRQPQNTGCYLRTNVL